MPYVEKQKDGTYLLVSQRDRYNKHCKFKGGPRKVFMPIYSDARYRLSSGVLKLYPYAVLNVGNLNIHCPPELAGKKVCIKVHVLRRKKNV